MTDRGPAPGDALDLTAGGGRAVLWGMASEDLNVNLVRWEDGDGVDVHRNTVCDVLLVCVEGAVDVTVDGDARRLVAPACVLIPVGAERAIRAVGGPARYLTAHRRRPPLGISGAPDG